MADKTAQLAHMVYFSLKDRSAPALQKQVEACHKYLTGHPGVVYFSVATRVPDLTREVNDQDFDVALNLVFQDRQAHDEYQTAPRHLAFMAECKPDWARVRVYDSYVK